MAKSSKSGESKAPRTPSRRRTKPAPPSAGQSADMPVAEKESSALTAMESPGSLARPTDKSAIIPPASREAPQPQPMAASAASPGKTAARGTPPRPRVEEIRRRAFELYLERGGAHGRDVDDWLRAEKELLARR